MNIKQVKELVDYGKIINVRVTGDYLRGHMVANIRDFQFSDFVMAIIYLQSIERLEVPEYRARFVA